MVNTKVAFQAISCNFSTFFIQAVLLHLLGLIAAFTLAQFRLIRNPQL